MRKPRILSLFVTVAVLFAAFIIPAMSKADEKTPSLPITSSVTTSAPIVAAMSYKYIPESNAVEEPTTVDIEVDPFSDEEVTAIAMTLAGECYDDKLEDKRSVAEVICNRVSDGGFGETVMDVVSAKGQFAGYWKQSRPISESDIQIAEDTLRDWYNNDCEKLSDYLFFCAGPNRENVFRTQY